MSGSGSPTTGPLNPAVQALQQRVAALEALVAGMVQQLGAPGTPIVDAFFGRVSKWQKDKLSVIPMPFGDPNGWLTADYDPDQEVCNCFAPKQLFLQGVTPVVAFRFWNTDRHVILPLHLAYDDADDPELPYWEPTAGELEASADFTGVPPAFDDINCPGEED